MGVDGTDDLLQRLNELANIEPVVRSSVRKQAEIVRGVAVGLCPVYAGDIPGVSSGELRGSIYTKIECDADKVTGIVYTNKEYAAYVEFGTGPIGEEHHSGISPEVPVAYTQKPWWVWPDAEGGFHYTKGQPAQPFMYPALNSMEDQVVEGLKNDLQTEIRKVGGG